MFVARLGDLIQRSTSIDLRRLPLWLRLVAVALFLASQPVWAASLHEQIDQAIVARAGGEVAPAASDAEFVRRVSLDLAGIIPTPEVVMAFVADADPAKREKLIDRLLAAPEYGRQMQAVMTSMLLERRTGSGVTDQEWNKYLSEAFNSNKPWDQITRELLFADDDEQLKPARKFFTVTGRDKNPHQMTLDVARLFLGRSILCSQCHDHPDVPGYNQDEYFGLYSYLQEKPEQARSEFESVFIPGKKETMPRLPAREAVSVPTFSKEQVEDAKKFRPRLLLARDLPTPENRLFVWNSVNRFWFQLLGRGLVHPLDLVHPDNPPSHPELLELLADDFVGHKFDVKYLLREITLTQTYQRSSQLPARVDPSTVSPASYRVFNPRPLSPDQLAWSLMRATGNQAAIEAAPVSEKTEFGWYNYINGKASGPPSNLPEVLDLFIGVFGNPPGEAEVDFNPSMGQALFLRNERLFLDWLKPKSGNLMERLAPIQEPGRTAEALTMAIYSRPPTEAETVLVSEQLARTDRPRVEILADVAWALLTSDEFRLNH